jgi:hypothetical protein
VETKPCRKCGSTKRYKPKRGRKLGNCKACQKTNSKAWRKANPEEHRAKCKAWRKANPEKYRTTIKTWQKNNPDKHKAINKAWRQTHPYKKDNPEKHSAHVIVNSAVRRGDLPRVSTCDCVDCGIQAAEYHHEDYSKPLEVEPLCKKCHIKRHNSDN